MLTLFGKKKLTAERVAHLFVNTLIETVEKGFPDVAGFINDSPEFTKSPCIQEEDYGKFLMIVIAGNFCYMPQYLNDGQEGEIVQQCISKFAPVFEMNERQFSDKVKEYRDFMSRVNSPSKNTLYGMSKAVFFKYDLNKFQDEYFMSMRTPNPIFLKNLDEIIRNFIWDWEAFNEKYRVVNEAA